MNIHSELAAGDIQWGDVAAWAEAIGTTGTLITGMFILLRDRMNLYRALINDFRVNLDTAAKGEPPRLTLVVENPLVKGFYDIDIQLLGASALFEDGHESDIGLRLSRAQLMSRRTLKWSGFEGSSGVLPEESILTYRVTDSNGRTWLVERRKLPKLVNRWNRARINRRMNALNALIKQRAGGNYIEPYWEDCEVIPIQS